MEEPGPIVELVVAVAAALAGGVVAQRLRQPVILGYLLAGVLIGPYSPISVGEVPRVQVMAEIGVALLMFALGAELSLAQLQPVRRVALFGGTAQILLTVGLGVLIGPRLGLDLLGSAFFGAIIALSSTMVALKILMERGEIDSLHGRVVLGFLIVQDLSVVPLMVILPALAQPLAGLPWALAWATAKAAFLLAATYYLGTRLVPWTLLRIAATGSRELFVLTVVTWALGAALLAYAFGLSLAFGAFLAGLLVSESEFSHQVVAEVLPLRDIFATLFFVSVGMLINPLFLLNNAAPIALTVVAIVGGKFVIGTALPLALGYSGKVAVYTGLALAQIGEFSFVLARMGVERGLIGNHLYSLTLAGALASILVSPLVMAAGVGLVRALRLTPLLSPLFAERVVLYDEGGMEKLSHHTVICGFGRIGRELADALDKRGFKYLVIEYDPYIAREVRRRGIPCIYGDAANPAVLAHANLPKARVLAVTIPDFPSAEVVVRNARGANPRLDIVARAHGQQELHSLYNAGATEVVHPEFEAGLEFVRHTMHRFGIIGPELQSLVSGRRTAYYRR